MENASLRLCTGDTETPPDILAIVSAKFTDHRKESQKSSASLELYHSLDSASKQLEQTHREIKKSSNFSFFKGRQAKEQILQAKDSYNRYLKNFRELLEQEDVERGKPLSDRFNEGQVIIWRSDYTGQHLKPFKLPSKNQHSQTNGNAIKAGAFSPRPL